MKDEYTKENIMAYICQLINENFNVRHEATADNRNVPLTSSFFGLSAIQLYQILMAVEEKYNVYFSVSKIEDNGFLTVDDIARLVQMNL